MCEAILPQVFGVRGKTFSLRFLSNRAATDVEINSVLASL
ncbi:hypothetical protein OROMI_018773 [Orobanche minor]